MKAEITPWKRVSWLLAGLLALVLPARPAAGLDVIGPDGVIYVNVSDSSHFAEAWTGINLFTYDLTGVPVGSTLSGAEFAKSGGGTSYVSFDLDKVYTGIGSVFYAQRAGNNATADKISMLSLWASDVAPFFAGDPGVPADSVVAITNTAGAVLQEYLLTNTLAGQYFLVKFEQFTSSGNPGGNELRLGANLQLPPSVIEIVPAATNAYDGNSVAFSVRSSGSAPITFQWQAAASGAATFTNLVNGVSVAGATSPSVTLKSLPLGAIDVRVVLTNPYGTTTSSVATVSIMAGAPQITQQTTPATLQQPAGYAFTLRVIAEGSQPMQFQWKRNGVDLGDGARISGARSNVLTIVDAQATDAGTYHVVASNAHGNAPSDPATVTIVPSLPVIGPTGALYTDISDSSRFGATWGAANLFANNVTGLAPGSTLGGSEYARSGPGSAWVAFRVDQVYTVGSIYFAQRAGSTTGDNMQRLSIWSSETAAFTTTDPGTAPASVIALLPNTGTPVWREYFLTNNLRGKYFLLKLEQTTITGNPGGNEFRLGLAQAAVILTSSPTNTTVFSGNSVQFSVAASGEDPLTYRWQSRAAGSAGAFVDLVNGPNVSGATSSVLSLHNVPLANMEYRVVVSNSAGSATSDPATLTVTTAAPEIVSQPQPAALRHPSGYPMALKATVTGSGPMYYQWQRNEQPIVNDARISGANSIILDISVVQAGDAGTYRLIATNTFGSATSSEVVLTIDPALGFSDGSAWTLNGGATLEGGVLTLTDGGAGQARSAYFNSPVPIEAFSASFIYQDVNGGGADGVAFILQNSPAGTAALGGAGGYLGYAGITPSAALLLNLYGTAGISVKTGGEVGSYVGTSPVNIAGGSPILVSVRYASGTMVVTLTDTLTQDSYTNTFNINLEAAVGGKTALVGFSGADGSITSIQQVSEFAFAPLGIGAPQILADVKPAAVTQPVGLSLQLSAAVAGSAPLSFQWKRNGQNLVNDARITGANSNVLRVAHFDPADVGSYQLFITNFFGWTNTSAAAVAATNDISIGDGTAWTLNGGALIDAGSVLTVTDGGGQARSAFLTSPIPIDGFTAAFTYIDALGGGADGLAFVIHNSPDGPAAIGGGGGGLGYSGITPSAAVEFNIYANSTGGRGFAFATNGFTAQNGGAPYVSTAPIDLASGRPIDVVVRYVPGVLSLTFTDASESTSFSTNMAVDLAGLLRSKTGWVGFTGGTGGSSAVQQIYNVAISLSPTLDIEVGANNTAIISWPITAVGFDLQQSTTPAGGWLPVAGNVTVVNGRNQVTVPISGTQFFRLALP